MSQAPVVIGIVAPSGTGKTTLLCRLIPRLKARGLRVGAIKYTHHDVEVDRPGKDSYRLRESGASEVMLIARRRWMLCAERPDDSRLPADEAVTAMRAVPLDLVLVEGDRGGEHPKIELFRAAVCALPRFPDDDDIVAVATDDPLPVDPALPVLPLGRLDGLVEFLESMVRAAPVG